ncbi:MAG: Hsp70 family protein [Deltaproteobacteria bacterium]|nr:MAG: Hsp70 family protein [Deltaproteobacteria bacterium]TMQ12047.1 MAG: Hsp70 family protein [Deltaproteobacteria bacterium]
MPSDVTLGIDFGTSCTSAGILIGDRVELIHDGGDPVIPSVVYAPERGPLEAGRPAQARLLSDPACVIRSVKRVLGVAPASPLVRSYAAAAPFRVEASGDHLTFRLRAARYAPEQIAGAILTRVRELAETRFGGPICKAVITASVAAAPGYRDALVRAARIAHLDVLEVVPEPIAGALAVGLHGEQAERKLLVCDFGGGTFDVSALVQSGLRFTPVATAGDEHLGGDDLDLEIAEALAGLIARRTGYDVHRDAVRWSEVVFRCEMAKRQLTAQTAVPFAMREAYVAAGRWHHLDFTLERGWVEERWTPLFERVAIAIYDALRRAGWRRDDVDQVAMIGGSALVPMFQRTIADLFPGPRVVLPARADVAVAIGTVLLTARFGAERRAVPVLGAPLWT